MVDQIIKNTFRDKTETQTYLYTPDLIFNGIIVRIIIPISMKQISPFGTPRPFFSKTTSDVYGRFTYLKSGTFKSAANRSRSNFI